LLAVAAVAAPQSQQQALWEFGLGVGALAIADYRGADTGRAYLLPLPYFVYRGRILKADRDGVHGLIFRRKFAELKVSASATTPVRSNDSLARRGMPSLPATVELGPALELHLWRSEPRRAHLDLRLPTTVAMTLQSTPRVAGWTFAPRLNLDLADVGGHVGWNLGLLFGPLYGDRRYHDYFYGVTPQYATTARPAYQARAGYAGAQTLIALSKRFPGYWIGAFVRYDTLSGAVFAHSPLLRRQSYWMGGIGIAWMISHSSHNVVTDNEWP
jgi:outer membrane scaffolding protein for murein synthesis (MipA/OmpV family)